MSKNFFTAAAIVLLVSGTAANAQNVLGRLGERAKNAVENKVGNAVENAINNAGKNKSSKDAKDTDDDAPAGTAGYQKSDFVPGANAFFFDDVKKEKVGEFPSMWDLRSGDEIEVATYNGENVIKIGGWHTEMEPLMKQKDYLPEEFTIEYEVLTTGKNAGSNNDHLDIVFYSDEHEKIMKFDLNQDGADQGGADGEVSYLKPNGEDGNASYSGNTIAKLVKKNTWTKVELSFNQRALKIYVNGTRIINVPNMMQPKRMYFRSVSNSDVRDYFFIRNIRIANGAVELYDKNQSSNEVEKAMAETGKFVTNNILFETGKADIKPESMAEIQRVADYMKKNTSVRFEVQGHCDNSGSDKVNDPLSQSRAEAIVKALVAMGVDEWNLRAVGKGSHEPVADNSTEEGRAKNRRVEFIKK